MIMEPTGSTSELRRPTTKNVDIWLGKRISLSEKVALKLDGKLLSAFNDNAHLWFATLALNPGDSFVAND